ncbi:MAG: hypothetical protein Q9162_005940 [Coniocarpon cinnabarinum]
MAQRSAPSRQRGADHNRAPSLPPRKTSVNSNDSEEPPATSFSPTPKPSYAHSLAATQSTSSLSSVYRNHPPPPIPPKPNMSPPIRHDGRPRQHSQGFFEPSLPSHAGSGGSILNASAIAAQAAMHFPKPHGHDRRRSKTDIEQTSRQQTPLRKTSNPPLPPPIQTNVSSGTSSAASNRSAGPRSESTAAANAAFPRSPVTTPPPGQHVEGYIQSPVNEKDTKASKEKTKRKLFSKPNRIHITKDRDVDRSTIKTVGPYGSGNRPLFNGSTTSLAEPTPASSLYSLSNASASTSTLVPAERGAAAEKEKHKHNFLSRQKQKLKDDHHALALSSASSNSQPVNPSAPQPLYSFAPSSPGLVNKSISGLDLRHGGRALREKKKEEKEKAAATPAFVATPRPGTSTGFDPSRDVPGTVDEAKAYFGPPSNMSAYGHTSELGIPNQGLSGFGLQGMSADDAWHLLKARLLNIFEGEDLRTPVEDFNRLVSVHVQRCITKRAPINILEDLRELLFTGFTALDQTLRTVPDDHLVASIVETWTFVFCTVLPFLQAALLPLDLEFKGHGTMLAPQAAADFWTSVTHSSFDPKAFPSLDIRTLTLLHFRDVVILPRHETLLTIFSRLSIDSLAHSTVNFHEPNSLARPGTSSSASAATTAGLGLTGLPSNFADPSSYNSQSSTLLSSSNADSFDTRSRATSNTSAGSFPSAPRSRAGTHSNHPPLPQAPPLPLDSAKITETAGRMLQCFTLLSRLRGTAKMLVVASTGEKERDKEVEEAVDAGRKMERLSRELKLNWMGRSRVGGDRRGLVGSRGGLVGLGTPALGGGSGGAFEGRGMNMGVGVAS